MLVLPDGPIQYYILIAAILDYNTPGGALPANSEALCRKHALKSTDCYLWDFVDEGIDTALDRIKNETGVTGIVIHVHCPGLLCCDLMPASCTAQVHRPKGGPSFNRISPATRAPASPDRLQVAAGDEPA